MTLTTGSATAEDGLAVTTFDSLDPSTGRVLGRHPVAKAITAPRFALPTPLLRSRRNPQLTDVLARVVAVVHGRR